MEEFEPTAPSIIFALFQLSFLFSLLFGFTFSPLSKVLSKFGVQIWLDANAEREFSSLTTLSFYFFPGALRDKRLSLVCVVLIC
jgi:hypothetical protein